MPRRLVLPVAFASIALGACVPKEKPTEPEQAATPTPEPASIAAPSCVGPVTGGKPETLTFAGVTWERTGSTLKRVAPAGERLALGVVSDIKETSDENVANLRALVEWFKTKQVDAIVVSGDTGEEPGQIVAALDILAQPGVPVLTIIGNREGVPAYTQAMATASAKHPNVLDLGVIRRVDTAHADLVSLPGYYNANYIHAEKGCQYGAQDVAALSQLVSQSDSPVVLVSHGGPLQSGKESLDLTHDQKNVGDPELAKWLAQAKVPFGIFGNVHEAGGRATNLAGDVRLEEGKLHDQLYLNPGPADAVVWMMNDGTKSAGMGALLTLEGSKASYEIHRLPLPAEPAQAKK